MASTAFPLESSIPGESEGVGEGVTEVSRSWGSQAWRKGLEASAIGEAVITVLTVLGNSAVIFIIVRPRNKDRLRTPLNLLILMLAVSDLLVGSISEPMTAYNLAEGINNPIACAFYLLMSLTVGKASMLGFALVSVERFVAIRFPYKHARVFSLRNGAIIWAVVWIFSFIYGLVPTLIGMNRNWDEQTSCNFNDIIPLEYLFLFSVVGTYTLEGLVIIVIYTYLFIVVRRQLHRIANMHVPEQPETTNPMGSLLQSELRAAFRCFVMILVYFICQWPLAVKIILEWEGFDISYKTIYGLLWMRRLNSAINPFCYAFATQTLREELLKLFPCSWAGSSDNSSDPVS